jgi:small subunit ribosomal protein S6
LDGAGLVWCARDGRGTAVGDRLKEYELLFIVSPRVAADDVQGAIERVEGLVRESGGEVLGSDNWGRRRLAYPIKHYFEGTYVLLTLRMEPRAAAPLEASLIISEEVIRHLLTEGIIPPTNRDRGRPAFDDRDRDRDRDRERGFEAASDRSAATAVAEAPAATEVASAAAAAEPAGDEPATGEAEATPVEVANAPETPEPVEAPAE